MRRRDTSARSSASTVCGVLASMRISPHIFPPPNSRNVPPRSFPDTTKASLPYPRGRQAGSLLSSTPTPWRRLRNASGRSALGPAPGLASARCAELPGGSAKRAFKPATASADIPRGASLRPSGTMNVNLGRQPARRAVATLALALLFGLAACEARAGIAFVKNVGTATGNNIGTNITITLASGVSVAAGNSVILSFVGADVAGAYSATDSAGNAYGADVQGARSGTVRTVILSAHNVNALAGGSTITVTFPSTSNRRDIATYKADSNCGNGSVDSGEDCDQGPSNGTAGSCCSASCRFQPSTTVCRAAANECDVADSCTGSSATCPADTVKAAGTACTDDGNPCTTDLCDGTAGAPACTHPAGNAGAACRAAAGECDVAETCDGSSTACPTDFFKASGTTCTDDGNPCTTDVCNGTSATCTHPAGNPGAVCRAAAGECDAAETCTGTSTTCPADAKQPAGTACTADANPCTLDQCDGSTNTCTHPAGNAGAVCRAGAGECDVAETCTGTSTTCPTNAFKANGTACTDDGNVCTRDICNGASATCTHPAGNAGTVCRAAAGPCDAAETCTGTSTTCPADAFLSSSTVCRAAVDVCDAAESCTGSSATCPADAIKAAGTVCRAAAGECDVAESCTGTSTACPTDAFQASGTTCTDDGNACTSDVCSGTSATCTHPAGNAGAVCRAAVNECDVAETCPGATSITFHGAASASSGSAGSATSLAISRPAATAGNDVMVAAITAHGSSSVPTITPPAGWTLIVNTTQNGQNLAR